MNVQEQVAQAFANAKENEFTFDGWSVSDIAEDMQSCDSDLENVDIEDIKNAVSLYLASN